MKSMGKTAAVEGRHIVKNFRTGDAVTEVLKDLSLQVMQGEFVSIMGPSGSGKSTFLRCMNLLEEPTSGHIFFEGTDITDKNTDINLLRRKMGMVFQQFNLFPHMSIMKNMTIAPVKLLGVKEEDAVKEAEKGIESRG